LMHVPPGFAAPDTIQTARIFVSETQIPDSESERLVRMEEAMVNKIAAIPGVSSVSFSTAIPMDGHNSNDLLLARDRPYKEGELTPIRRFKFISPGFLGTLGTPLVAGRDLTWTDIYHKIPVAIVSESLAREFWHDAANSLGKQIRVGNTDDWREVIGVAADVHDDGVNQPAPTSVYWPVMMDRFEGRKEAVRRDIAFAIRSPRAGSEAFMKEIQQVVWSADPNLPLADVHTVGYFYNKSMARTSFTLIMLAVAGGMALLLGIVGIYGVISYSVSQRTREIGIRMALGAAQNQVIGAVIRDALRMLAAGLALGIPLSLAATRWIASFLYGLRPSDPLTYCAVIALLCAASLAAAFVPSRRAARVDPMVALRCD
jgi:predicted permease